MPIVVAFLILVLLVLWFIIGSKGKWWLKALVMVMSLHLSLSISSSLPDFAGWPSTAPVPDEVLVHWMVVEEPNKRTKKEGSIYLWATNLSEEIQPQKEGWHKYLFSLVTSDPSQPRVHRLPYSTEDHEKAEDIIGRIKNGESIVGTRNGNGEGSEGDGQGEGEGDGSGQEGGDGSQEGKDGNGSGGFSLSDDITFQQLPPPFLPPKD